MFAWSSPASVPISGKLMGAQNTAGSTSSTAWSGCLVEEWNDGLYQHDDLHQDEGLQ